MGAFGASGARVERIFEKHGRCAGRRGEQETERKEKRPTRAHTPPPPQVEGDLGFCGPVDEQSGSDTAQGWTPLPHPGVRRAFLLHYATLCVDSVGLEGPGKSNFEVNPHPFCLWKSAAVLAGQGLNAQSSQ